jgi:hypothetical protein
LAAFLLGAPGAVARSPKPGNQPRAPETYGTSAVSYYTVDATAFIPMSSAFTYSCLDICQYRYLNNTTGDVSYAPVHLPGGALLTYMELDFYDISTAGEEHVSLVVCDAQGQGCSTVQSDCLSTVCSGIPDANGAGTSSQDLSAFGIQIDNDQHRYFLLAGNTTVDGTTAMGQVIVGYVLQVSPAPGTATFSDVPTSHPFFQYIEALAASGITGGCGGGKYCPDAPLTRGQMAVFLSKALGLEWP